MFGRIGLVLLCTLAVVAPDATFEAAQPASVAAVPGHEVPGEGASHAANPSAAPANPSPARLVIPKIGVDARIEARGLDSSRNMMTPNDFHDVAWYNLGPTPGQPGNALMNGHVDWWTGSAVFTRLTDLRPGDAVIVVRGDGTRITFKVKGMQTVAANARVSSLFAPSRVATLTLITCTGIWNPGIMGDTHRLLVSAVLA